MWGFVLEIRRWLTPPWCGVQEQTVLVGLTSLITRNPPMPPKFNRRRALFVLGKIDEILAWEQRKETERDTKFVELGRYLCEVRISGPDKDQVDPALVGHHGRDVGFAVLAHRARVERADLVPVLVGGADEASRVVQQRLPYRRRAHPVVLQPAPVVLEVGPDRADKQRAQAEQTEPEGDVGRDPAPPDGQVVDEKRQRDLIQLVGDELIGELAGKRHQVVGRDRTCDRYAHGSYPGLR